MQTKKYQKKKEIKNKKKELLFTQIMHLQSIKGKGELNKSNVRWFEFLKTFPQMNTNKIERIFLQLLYLKGDDLKMNSYEEGEDDTINKWTKLF